MDRYAVFFRRVAAYVLDVTFVLLLLMPVWLWFLHGLTGPKSGVYLLGVSMFLPFMWTGARFFYLVLFWLHRGETLGMRIMGIRVRRADGGPLHGAGAVLRYVGIVLSTATLGIGFLAALFEYRGRALQDVIGGTVVVPAPRRGPT